MQYKASTEGPTDGYAVQSLDGLTDRRVRCKASTDGLTESKKNERMYYVPQVRAKYKQKGPKRQYIA
jgi:hypothetical protein